jgi:hypothetical protein
MSDCKNSEAPDHALVCLLRKISASHSIVLAIVIVAATALDIFLEVLAGPRVKDSTSPLFSVIAATELFYVLFAYSLLIVGVVLLLRRKLFMSVCYLAAGALGYMSFYAVAALKGDRLTFPAGAHREIAAIYERRDVDFEINNASPHLVSLGEQCHPPDGCGCWVLIDPGHTTGVENDRGGWRRPTASIFITERLPMPFAIANVRVLDSAAYSVLGCNLDFFAWKLD